MVVTLGDNCRSQCLVQCRRLVGDNGMWKSQIATLGGKVR